MIGLHTHLAQAGAVRDVFCHGHQHRPVVLGRGGQEHAVRLQSAELSWCEVGDNDDAAPLKLFERVERGDAGDDWLAGGYGDDDLAAGSGADTLDGGAGNDRMSGLDGEGDDFNEDFLNGDSGNDTLALGAGDHGHGGDGADDFVVHDWLMEGGVAHVAHLEHHLPGVVGQPLGAEATGEDLFRQLPQLGDGRAAGLVGWPALG